ncbi:hypothetical protein [Wenjunlia vitaminophila]|uniref:hypothetical protein n=1 Tax=Wenjunlia vitaminophila TaxID=76728 RepID=UPI0012FE85BC|nr:hypothetical protein [Wenjunlia vitaminophila]
MTTMTVRPTGMSRAEAGWGTSTRITEKPTPACVGKWDLYDKVEHPDSTVSAAEWRRAYERAYWTCVGCPLAASCGRAVWHIADPEPNGGYPLTLPWARYLTPEDLGGFLGELAAACSGGDKAALDAVRKVVVEAWPPTRRPVLPWASRLAPRHMKQFLGELAEAAAVPPDGDPRAALDAVEDVIAARRRTEEGLRSDVAQMWGGRRG